MKHWTTTQAFLLKRIGPMKKLCRSTPRWRNPRVAAQQGHFSVHGLDRRPLEEQVDESILRSVTIPAIAAVYGV